MSFSQPTIPVAHLRMAEERMFHSDFCPYLELKELLARNTPQDLEKFRLLFSDYYGLKAAVLSQRFTDQFFEILFKARFLPRVCPNYGNILRQLEEIPLKRKGGLVPTLQFSFVSKLVAMHLESSPIYDRHVRRLFGVREPGKSCGTEARLAWFCAFLGHAGNCYREWAQNPEVKEVLDKLRARDDRLAACHEVRLIDFLVWKAGNQKFY